MPAVLLPLARGTGLILIAATVLAGTMAYLHWMVPVVVLMLSTAACNAWELMLGLVQHKGRASSGSASTDVNPSEAKRREPR